MTPFELGSLLIAALTLVVIVLSVFGLRRQLVMMRDQNQQLRRTLVMSAEMALDGQFSVATQAFLDYPELRAIFNPREAKPVRMTRHLKLRAAAVAELLCDAMERALMLKGDAMSTASLINWMRDSFAESEFLAQWLHEHRDWYSEELLDIAGRKGRPDPVDVAV